MSFCSPSDCQSTRYQTAEVSSTRISAMAVSVMLGFLALAAKAQTDIMERDQRGIRPMLRDAIDRPLRYTPDRGDFVITNGNGYFNRPLYGSSSPFRVDGGDRPEFSLYLPGRGGNLRIGVTTHSGTKWLNDAERVTSRYRAGSMVYDFSDPLLGSGTLHLTAIAPREAEGLVIRIDGGELSQPVELIFAFGGITGERGSRDGDVGTERVGVRDFFQFRPEYCRDNDVALGSQNFMVRAKGGSVAGIMPAGARITWGNAELWDKPDALFATEEASLPVLPLVLGRASLTLQTSLYLALQQVPFKESATETLATYREVAAEAPSKSGVEAKALLWKPTELPAVFARADADRQAIAQRVTVETPDPYLNAAVSALMIAADGVWDDRQMAYLHGGVAWRARLLGWRVSYAGDALGWHERTRAHFDGYASRQNIEPIAEHIPPAEASANLARNETALHSNGDLTKSHYDMNLVGVDAILRHLLWTGDLDYAQKLWPTLERHLAWERRLFRREFGSEKLPLYEAYCCIWASDAISYNGGGTTHATAYNLYQNRLAAQIAKRIGADPSLYLREASLIERAMREHLWLKDRGWYAEWKDLMGLQLVHPSAAAWTFYHTIDSEVPTSLEAWQMSRYVDHEIPHFPIQGPRVPAGNYTISTTTWMPYAWSVNNVVLAESVHTALSLWQAGRRDAAYPLLKGALLDSMFLGICPGNVGMATWFDVNRRESQRDFGDGVGALSRAIVEGVFGVLPDLLDGQVRLKPGFPTEWDHATMRHPDFDFLFKRQGVTDRYELQSRFPRPVQTRLQVAARSDIVERVTVNGKDAPWHPVADCVGTPLVEVIAAPAAHTVIAITWRGKPLASTPTERAITQGVAYVTDLGVPISGLTDPQGVLEAATFANGHIKGMVVGTPGHRTVFARVSQGQFDWWQPLAIDVTARTTPMPRVFVTDWNKPLDSPAKLDPVNLRTHFNDHVSQIFNHDYISPRPPHVSLGIPKQGYGYWTGPTASFAVDDTGIRSVARKDGGTLRLPNGVPLVTTGEVDQTNVAFVSQWDNFPSELSIPLSGHARKVFLLMAGSTWAMQSRIQNGELVFTYADGTSDRLSLENPTTWWPIDQDYFVDDFAFKREGGFPIRVDLKSGAIRVIDRTSCQITRRTIAGGAATVIDFELNPEKELKSLTVRATANEVIIGLMSATLQRP